MLAVVLCFSACEDQLEQTPFSQIGENNFWKNNSDAITGVASIYDAMQRAYGSARNFNYGEFRSDNVGPTPTSAGDNFSMVTNTISPNWGGASWTSNYQMISRANNAISAIPKIQGASQALLGEAHFLRAFAYFDLVRVFGGVPLQTEPIISFNPETAFKERSTPQDIYEKVIIPDMIKAEQLIPAGRNQFRATKNSALILQGEVYMWLKDWAKAKVAFGKVEATKNYSLVTTRAAWNELFWNTPITNGVPNNSGVQTKFMRGPELIFSIKYSLLEDAERSGIFGNFFGGVPAFYMSAGIEQEWINDFPLDSLSWSTKFGTVKPLQVDATGKPFYGDFRFFESKEQNNLAVGEGRIAKYNKTNLNNAIDDCDIHIYRYAGLLYNMAEVENNLNNIKGAIALCNRVRAARLLPQVKDTDFKTKEQTEDFILQEKRYEQFAEGKRWWDLVRTGKALKVLKPEKPLTEETILWPIFQNHLIDNPKLKQNPGYN